MRAFPLVMRPSFPRPALLLLIAVLAGDGAAVLGHQVRGGVHEALVAVLATRLVQPEADAQGLDRILLQARVAGPGTRGIAGEHAEQEKIQDDHKQDGKRRPPDFLQQVTVPTQGLLPAGQKEGRPIGYRPSWFKSLSYLTGSTTTSELTSDNSTFAMSVIQPANLSTR